jgi:hypothetical protein
MSAIKRVNAIVSQLHTGTATTTGVDVKSAVVTTNGTAAATAAGSSETVAGLRSKWSNAAPKLDIRGITYVLDHDHHDMRNRMRAFFGMSVWLMDGWGG